MKRAAAVIALLLAPALAQAAPSVLIRSEVSPREIYIGDPLEMRITVVYSTGIAPAPVQFPKALGEFELLSAASSKPRPDKRDRMAMVHTLTLTTFSTGTVTVASVPLYFQGENGSLSEARTEEVAVTVKSLLAEKGDEGSLRPLKGLFNARSLWPLWALLAAVLAGAAGWWIAARRRRRAAGGGGGPVEPALSPEDEALQALTGLENSSLIAEAQFKEFYSALSGILRRYAERRYAIPAPEMTSSELLAALRKAEVPTEPLFTIRAFLDNADLVKFARLTPDPVEITGDIDRVRQFVNATTPRPAEPPPAEAPPEEAMSL
jgi:hypothetical protein